MTYGIQIKTDYPTVALVYNECPSKICEHLNTTTFVSLDFYRDGERRVKLTDGEDISVYFKTAKDLFEDNN